MHKLGEGQLLFVGTFLVPERETLQLEATLVNDVLPVSINFLDEEREDKSPVSWKTVDGCFHLTFHGQKESTGLRIIQSPVSIGGIDDQPLSVMASVHKHYKAFQVTVQFMVGGTCL